MKHTQKEKHKERQPPSRILKEVNRLSYDDEIEATESELRGVGMTCLVFCVALVAIVVALLSLLL